MQVSLGWSHALGLDNSGRVWAWGSNRYGQCGRPPDSPAILAEPTQLSSTGLNTQTICIAAGSEHSAAVTADGSVYTWGWGEHGQLGVGDELNLWQPTHVSLPPCAEVICGSGFTTAIVL